LGARRFTHMRCIAFISTQDLKENALDLLGKRGRKRIIE
jgi:hypothetical protein